MVTLQDAKELTDVIVRSARPVSVILFGSVAREGTGGDLDVLVITDDAAGEPSAIDRSLHNDLRRFYKKFAIDHFVVSLSALRTYRAKGSPFLRSILKEGRFLYMKDALREWLRQAEDEYRMAEYLLKGGYFKGACFHAQQSVEKAIKTRLLRRGWDLEKTHSIERLRSIGEEYKVRIGLTDDEIAFIGNIADGIPQRRVFFRLGNRHKRTHEKPLPSRSARSRRLAGNWRRRNDARMFLRDQRGDSGRN